MKLLDFFRIFKRKIASKAEAKRNQIINLVGYTRSITICVLSLVISSCNLERKHSDNKSDLLAQGKEIITIDREQISISRKNDILFRQKIYDLQEVKRFHVEEEHFEFDFWSRRNDLGVFRNRGTIRLEYGFKTIKFANDMDQAEANHILETLRSSGYLTATNF